MGRRASLAVFMASVAVLAVGIAALKIATPGLVRATFAVALLGLLVGTLGAIVRRRGPWVGFALFGWAYALAALSPPVRDAIEPILQIRKETDQVVAWLHPEPTSSITMPSFLPSIRFDESSGRPLKRTGLGSSDPMVPLSPSEQKGWEAWTAQHKAWDRQVEAMACSPLIGNLIAASVFAFLGAWAGHRLDERDRPARPISNSPVPPVTG